MAGLKISKEFFFEYGLELFKEQAPELFNYLCFAKCGAGSDCYECDDDISTDHDYDIGFLVIVPKIKEITSGDIYKLERIYEMLPRNYKNYQRNLVSISNLRRTGVITINDFYEFYLGAYYKNQNFNNFSKIPTDYLAEAINGEVFLDNYGKFSEVRYNLMNINQDYIYKMLCSACIQAFQTGDYNYFRMLDHHELAASIYSLTSYTKCILIIIYLLNHKFKPFYKWSIKKLDDLNELKHLKEPLEYILCNISSISREDMKELISGINKELITYISNLYNFENITYLDDLGRKINDLIKDSNIRNLDLLYCSFDI